MDRNKLEQTAGSAFGGFAVDLPVKMAQSDTSRPTSTLTMSIVETYQKCNKDFLPVAKKQHRILTQQARRLGTMVWTMLIKPCCRVYDKLVSNKGNTSHHFRKSGV